jgi:hypothetical protein
MSCGTDCIVAVSLHADISNIRWTLERLSIEERPSIEFGLQSSGPLNNQPNYYRRDRSLR